jgi:hypothetical protein
MILALAVGGVTGIVLQRTYSVGNILRGAGVAYPTRTPVPTATPNWSAEIPAAWQGQLSLFVLAGQSNMAGVGPPPEPAPTGSPLIFVFGNDYRWHLAQEPIDNPLDQVDYVSQDDFAGFSPGLSFAQRLLEERPNSPIGLIPCAKYSSFIDEWRPNLSDNTLYGSCLKRIQAASTMGTVAGFLFFQGESDALVEPFRGQIPYHHEWAARFTELVESLRQDLNMPTLPVVFAQIGPRPAEGFAEWETVQAQQASIRLPATVMITTDDLTLQDVLHYTADSYQVIGQRFAEAYLQLSKE